MVTDQQYWRLMKLRRTEKSLAQAAAKAGMDEKTAQKYLRLGKPPSQLRKVRDYRTLKNNFAGVWRELEELLERTRFGGAHFDGTSVSAIRISFRKQCVMKGVPTLKASNSEDKFTLPGLFQLFRGSDEQGMYVGDVIGLERFSKTLIRKG